MSAVGRREFVPQPVRLAREGRTTPRFVVSCGVCGARETVNAGVSNQLGTRTGGHSRATKGIVDAFARKGFTLGRLPGDDRCSKHATPQDRKDDPVTTRKPMQTPPRMPVEVRRPEPVVPPNGHPPGTPIPPDEPSREDKRRIVLGIEDVYERDRYSRDASDESVALRLKVPRAWVTAIREELFGPAGNEEDAEMRAMHDRASTWITQAETAMEGALGVLENAKKLLTEVGKRLDARR